MGRFWMACVFTSASLWRHPRASKQACRMPAWTKMVINCAYNAISAVTRARYGRMARFEPVRILMRRAIAEIVAVPRAEGVSLSEPAPVEAALRLGTEMSGALSSTAQDIARSTYGNRFAQRLRRAARSRSGNRDTGERYSLCPRQTSGRVRDSAAGLSHGIARLTRRQGVRIIHLAQGAQYGTRTESRS